MKILRVISSMDPKNGGPGQGIRNSIPSQELLGVKNEVVCFDAPDADFLKNDFLTIHALGPAKGPYSYCSGFKSWFRVNAMSFDIVIIHGLWLYHSYGTFLVWQLYKNSGKHVPQLYLMPHGMLDPYFQRTKTRRLKAIRNWIFWKFVENKVVNGSDGLLFTCEQELRLARETFKPYNPKKEINIGYGIQLPPDFEEIDPTSFINKCPAVADKPYFLYLSRIHPKKGVDILLKAYLRLKKKYDKVPELVIAGPGLHTSYGRYLQKLSAGNKIHFPGMLMGEAKWGAFFGCQAFILSSHQENFGIAVVEAMACSRPVLISNQVNIWREVESGNGGIISEDTENGVYTMLEKWILQSEEEKMIIGENALKIFQNHYTTEKAALKMIKALS